MRTTLLTASLLTLFLLSFSQVSYAKSDNHGQNVSKHQQQNVKNFYLNLWAPDQVAPADAKPVEYGINYQYRYTPNSHEVQANDEAQTVVFKFHPDLKNRYQFRWISADQPQLVSFDKVKKRKIKVKVDAHTVEQDEDIYFEVWVYDTLTGEVLMCDPMVKVKM